MTADAIAMELAQFVHRDQFTEMRALHVGGRGRTFAGWFDGAHLRDLARNALALTRQAAAVFFVPNPVCSTLAAKRLNTILNVPKGFTLTHDADILERRFLIVDIDPRRLTEDDSQECPTTSRELVFARMIARDYVIPFLTTKGYSPPVIMCSGNGIHLIYRYSAALPTHGWGRAADPVAAALADLGRRFTCYGLTIDTNTFNPCRMLKVPGTFACKGEASPSRPHRIARIIEVPSGWTEPSPPAAAPTAAGTAKSTERRESNREVGTDIPFPTRRGSTQLALFDPGPDGTPVH